MPVWHIKKLCCYEQTFFLLLNEKQIKTRTYYQGKPIEAQQDRQLTGAADGWKHTFSPAASLSSLLSLYKRWPLPLRLKGKAIVEVL